jgi:hypothetical protein
MSLFSGKMVAKWSKQDPEQLKIDVDFMLWMVMDNLPFSTVDSEHFRNVMQSVNPRLNIKHSTTYAKYKLPLVYDTLIATRNRVLRDELPSCSQVALTFDHWSSRNNDPFLCITLHYLTEDFDLRKMTVAIVHHAEAHTAVNIAEKIDAQLATIPVLSDRKLKKVCVVDQAANMKKALTESSNLASFEEGSMACLDHKLNTALERALDGNDEVKSAIQAAKTVTSRLHQSYKSAGIVEKICKRMEGNDIFSINNRLGRLTQI